MNKSQFHKRLKHIYSHTKRDEHDSSFEDISNAFIADVVNKSNGGWDESIADENMRIAEHVFGVQPEVTQNAMQVKSKDSEDELERFLTDRNYSYSHIPESNKQTPDGHIEGIGHKYLCEIKSPILNFDHDAAPFGYKFSTTHSKILDAIHKAKKQLEKLDPEHVLPHILIYTSAHPQLNWYNFTHSIRGYIANQDGTITTDLRNTTVFKNTDGIVEDIDLYLWCQIGSGKKFYQMSYFSNQNSIHSGAINELIERLKSSPVSSMDNHTTVQAIRGES